MTEELSQNGSTMPLSPVLGSGQAVKLFRKIRKRSKQPQNLEPSFEEAPTVIQQAEDIFDRVKRLEASKLRESDIISSLSLNAKVPPLPSEATVSPLITYKPSSAIITKEKPLTGGPISFRTGTGKGIAISDSKIRNSKKLFEDILGPQNNSKAKENKHNYLHKGVFNPLDCESRNVGDHAAANSKIKNVFQDEDFTDLNAKEIICFQSAREKLLAVGLQTCMDKEIPDSKKLFEEVSGPHNNSNSKNTSVFVPQAQSAYNSGFTAASCSDLKKKNVFEGEDFSDLVTKETVGFQSASVNMIQLLSAKKNNGYTKSASLLQSNNNVSFKGGNLRNEKVNFKPAITTDKKDLIKSNSTRLHNIFKDENFSDLNLKEQIGFEPASSISKKATSRPQLSFKGPRNLFADENFDDLKLNLGQFKAASSCLSKSSFEGENFKGLIFPKSTTLKGKSRTSIFQTPYKTLDKNTLQAGVLLEESFHGFTHQEQQFALRLAQVIKNIPSKSRGITNKKRKYSEVDSNQNSFSFNSSSKRTKKRLGCPFSPTIAVSESGLKRAKLLFEDFELKPTVTSTPVKFGGDLAKPLSCDLTPIPVLKRKLLPSFSKQFLDVTLTSENNNRLSLSKPSHGTVREWLENLAQKRCLLEEQLRIIDEKEKILGQQKNIMEKPELKRRLPGALYRAKNAPQYKVHLQDYVHRVPSDDNLLISKINPQNAHLVHFNVCDKRLTYVKTKDGATIVPTIDSRIGLSEIEHSFLLMDGVDASLIPRGWIRNHYKWIVWKMASYERTFEDQFEGCLCLENVMQQLKYRYDVEIDNANRPILRKILEKDDCSERRMILCVSNIIKANNSYELELTDGWYPIRTLIDQPLCNQIAKGKIQLGVKLMIYGAKLMNCEGCHPLGAPESVYLNINYNCTRRALWWLKLGCQKLSGPFRVPISSVNMEGGKVGCIKCFISRVYPVKYLEKCREKKVWRNRKAEERREQEFYNEKLSISDKDLQRINDPVILYDIIRRSDDAEALQEMLSVEQKTMLYNYSLTNIRNTSRPARSVTPALKLKFVDASCDSDQIYDFHIWRPGEGHLQELQEGWIVSFLNVCCSPKWGFSASQSTQFRAEGKAKDDRFLKFKRKVTEIGFLEQSPCDSEFDTVGLVIEKRIDYTQQICWIADLNQNLLVININDSPKNILALDMINEGQIISVCNLVLKHCQKTHSSALGDYSVVFARYSQHRHLQDGLEKLEEDFLHVDRHTFIKECQNKIRQIEGETQILEMYEMECSQITMTDMALLECVEKLT